MSCVITEYGDPSVIRKAQLYRAKGNGAQLRDHIYFNLCPTSIIIHNPANVRYPQPFLMAIYSRAVTQQYARNLEAEK